MNIGNKKYKYLPITDPFCITVFHSAHDFLWDKDFVFSGESHDFWEVVCVLSGTVEIVEDNRVYILKEGNMIAHAPMEFHRIRSADGSSPHVLVSSFRYTGALPSGLADGVFHLSKDESNAFHEVVNRIGKYINGLEENRDDLAEAALSYASLLFRAVVSHKAHTSLSTSARAEKYSELVNIMQNSIYENLSLDDIAARAAVSVSTVKSLFRTYAAIGAKAYYCRLRGEEAERLLQSGLSASEVSDLLGFSSPNYFSLYYKKQFGVPPLYSRKHI